MHIDLLEMHRPMWARMQPMLEKKHLPHALLLTGPRHASLLKFGYRLMAHLLCQSDERPCGECKPCHLLMQGTYPDVHYVHPDAVNGPIKIEQIRALQHDVYQTPQCGALRFIVIEPADRLNIAAANALLKILEEPPLHTGFILIAEHVSSLPATVISRCQQYAFSVLDGPDAIDASDYLEIGQFYIEASARAELFQSRQAIIDDLCDVSSGLASPCTIAARWSSYPFSDLLWFLYLITAQAIRYQLINERKPSPWCEQLLHFSRLNTPMSLFQQLDKINSFMLSTQQNINLNQTLAVEVLLLGYSSDQV